MKVIKNSQNRKKNLLFYKGDNTMISVNDFRTGTTVEYENNIWQVIEFQHVKPGKGAAFVRTKLRNLRNHNIQEKTIRAGEKHKRAHINKKKKQYKNTKKKNLANNQITKHKTKKRCRICKNKTTKFKKS